MKRLLAAISFDMFFAMIALLFLGTLPVTAGWIVASAVMLIIAIFASVEGRGR